MRTEKVLWTFALACAVFLLFGAFTPRTMWFSYDPLRTGGTGSIRDSAGWDWFASLCGIAVIVGLAASPLVRPRVLVPVLGAAFATAAFAVTAVAADHKWHYLTSGAAEMAGFTMVPAPGPPYFATAAIVGTGFALVLLVSWLKPGDGEW